jgi:hypothetical protein
VLSETVGRCSANVYPACPLREILETEHASPTSEDICIARKRFKNGGLWEKLEGPSVRSGVGFGVQL